MKRIARTRPMAALSVVALGMVVAPPSSWASGSSGNQTVASINVVASSSFVAIGAASPWAIRMRAKTQVS